MKSKYGPLRMVACVFLFVGWAFPSQSTELPTYGTIDEIKNHRRVYVASEMKIRKTHYQDARQGSES